MKKELFLEEAVLDDLAQDFDHLELPLSDKTFKLLGGVVFFVVLVVFGEIVFLGGFKGSFYKERALINSNQITTLRAERGIIFDRDGKPISGNIPSFRLNLKLPELLKNEKARKETAEELEQVLSLEPNSIENLLKNVNLERQNSLTVARQLTIEQVIKIKKLNLGGVEIEDDFKREYPDGEIFSHILGFMGSVNRGDISRDSSLSLNDVIGKAGIEAFYDRELRGEDGEVINYKNAKGEVIEEKLSRKPVPGKEIYLTIDSGLQSYFYSRLKDKLASIGSRAGVGIAMNPQTGEILSLISLPSFNSNKIEGDDLLDVQKPFFNRAVSGVYTPGSIIKPLVATAALNEKIITPEKQIYSAGYIEIPNPYDPEKPSRFLDWKPHGWVDVYSALARSSNVYFYEVGGGFGNQKGLGILKLKEYWQKFGLGELTGIDLPAESKGSLPDPELKEKSGKGIWRIGDTYNISIGQGDLMITPIQLIDYISAIANGGKFTKPFLVKKILGGDGNVIKENSSQIIKDYSSDLGSVISQVQKGMIDGVSKPYGTSHALADLPMRVAAKTGTSQIDWNTKTNAFFVGYLPAEALAEVGAPLDKQIAILVLVENSREGSLNAVPVAKDVLNWYYYNRIKK
ncbi:penicillin-binding protein 2 [Candidatus Wolfebacteria bacterium]|nr:penicillin-binding protein 2 [Candidatus Wolfebacteria bacterium]